MKKITDHTFSVNLEREHLLSAFAEKDDLEEIAKGVILTGKTNSKAEDTQTYPQKHYQVSLGPKGQEIDIAVLIKPRSYKIKFSPEGIKHLRNNGFLYSAIKPQGNAVKEGEISVYYDS